ncbi:hypothetical protein CDAR_439861, partial [Caerostris darwini]
KQGEIESCEIIPPEGIAGEGEGGGRKKNSSHLKRSSVIERRGGNSRTSQK